MVKFERRTCIFFHEESSLVTVNEDVSCIVVGSNYINQIFLHYLGINSVLISLLSLITVVLAFFRLLFVVSVELFAAVVEPIPFIVLSLNNAVHWRKPVWHVIRIVVVVGIAVAFVCASAVTYVFLFNAIIMLWTSIGAADPAKRVIAPRALHMIASSVFQYRRLTLMARLCSFSDIIFGFFKDFFIIVIAIIISS